jgi:hypothetical protein
MPRTAVLQTSKRLKHYGLDAPVQHQVLPHAACRPTVPAAISLPPGAPSLASPRAPCHPHHRLPRLDLPHHQHHLHAVQRPEDGGRRSGRLCGGWRHAGDLLQGQGPGGRLGQGWDSGAEGLEQLD